MKTEPRFFRVYLEDGTTPAAVVEASSEAGAIEAFKRRMGVVDSAHRFHVAVATEAEHAADVADRKRIRK